MNLDRFEKVWAEIMSYFQKVLDFFKNLFGVKDPEAEADFIVYKKAPDSSSGAFFDCILLIFISSV